MCPTRYVSAGKITGFFEFFHSTVLQIYILFVYSNGLNDKFFERKVDDTDLGIIFLLLPSIHLNFTRVHANYHNNRILKVY